MAKKKDYLQKAEQGVILGTSLFLLNGLAGCSFEPMDTPPVATSMTKGPITPPIDRPVGPPGSGISYYPAGEMPALNTENKKYGFRMDYGYFKFETTIPWRDNAIIIKMNEDISGYAKKVTKVEVYNHPKINWFTRGNDLIIDNIKAVRGDGSKADREGYLAETVYITIYVSESTPVVLSFQYTL